MGNEEKSKYSGAPHVEAVVRDLIKKFHGHLVDAEIHCLFRHGKWESKGRTIYGTAEKVSEKWKHITGYDFIITINADAWDCALPEVREAIVDHELTHCVRNINDKSGDVTYGVVSHTVEEFVSIVQRHGLWTAALERMMKASESYKQTSIFGEDEEKAS